MIGCSSRSVIAFFFVGNTGAAICAAYGASAPAGFIALYWVGIAWGFSWWVLSDCRAHGTPTSIDHGWFVFYAWPVAVPYHVLRPRGIRGCGTLLALVGAFVASYVFALGVFYVMVGS
jgi:hypothetical protein